MRGFYRMGANTLAKVYLPRTPQSISDMRDGLEGSCERVADMGVMTHDVLRASNFMSGQARGTALGYYKQGADVGGPLVATPSFLRDELSRVVGEAASLGKDIESARGAACALPGGGRSFGKKGDSECAKLNRFVENTWSPFLKELHAFAGKHRSWHSRLWGSLYTEIQEYRKRVIGLRKVAQSLRVELTAPAPTLPPKPFLQEVGGMLKTVIYFLSGGILVWILLKFIGK